MMTKDIILVHARAFLRESSINAIVCQYFCAMCFLITLIDFAWEGSGEGSRIAPFLSPRDVVCHFRDVLGLCACRKLLPSFTEKLCFSSLTRYKIHLR